MIEQSGEQRDDVTSGDPGGMGAAIATLPEQLESGWRAALAALRDAGWRGPAPASGAACPAPSAAGVAACGMGGSAIGADIVRAAVPRLAVPFECVRGFSSPQWVGPGSIVVATSYSGETPETLTCAREAAGRRCPPVCITSDGTLSEMAVREGWPLIPVPGGLQPRAALGYLVSAVAAVLQAAGLGADLRTQVPAAVELLQDSGAGWSPTASRAGNLARSIARRLEGLRIVVYGADALAPAARRWKTQFNENAKLPAAFAEAPELLHNEVCGWADAPDLAAQTAAVLLMDPWGDERVLKRLELVAELIAPHAALVEAVRVPQGPPLARCLWACLLGDWTSYYVALARGVDPTPVTAIDQLKRRMAQAAE